MVLPQAVTMSRALKAVADGNRIRILALLVGGERCVSDLVARLRVDQPKVSHHLAILREAGVIRSQRDGRRINYSILPGIHRRAPTADGLTDVFDLGGVTITFRFGADAEPPRVVVERITARSAGADRTAVPPAGTEAAG